MRAPDVQTPAGGPASADESTDTETVDCADAHGKRIATIRARLALKGFAMCPLSCGGYIISRWDRSTYAPDARCAEKFLESTTGQRA